MDDRLDLTRRKALAAIGSIGVASAGAGLGTSAYFSDQETFENNRLTAGTLDMKVAATEYYSDWSSDEAALGGMAADAASTDIRLPAEDGQTDARDIAIDLADDHEGDVYAAFFDAIATGDTVNGGIDAATDDGLCGDVEPIPDADGPVIIDVDDVKPGDFGGAQFAFELCDNPGYVWLTGGLRSANENGVTEPEADDPDEEDGVVELLDEIQVAYGVGPINGDTSAFEDTDAGFQPVDQYTLREFLAMIGGDGVPLDGNVAAEIGGGTGDQGCFTGGSVESSDVHQVSVVWWLPIDHGNQVQSDSVSFDLGFYTEQCRHNDGATNLVAYYPFEGSANDLSGNGHDGSLVNDAAIGSGLNGRGLVLDGSDDYVEVPDDTALDITGPYTETAWVNLNSTSGRHDVTMKDPGQWALGFQVQNGRLRAGFEDESDNNYIGTGGTITAGTWTHLAVVYDGASVTGYVDGSQVFAITQSSDGTGIAVADATPATNDEPLRIGRGEESLDGRIDDLRIYSRALSANEVGTLASGP